MNIKYGAITAIVLLSLGGLAAVVFLAVRSNDQGTNVLLVLGFVAPTIAAFMAWLRTEEVHVMVNSQKDKMLAEIADLKSKLLVHESNDGDE